MQRFQILEEHHKPMFDFGIPRKLVMDGAREQAGNKYVMMKRINKYDIKSSVCEPERHNQNQDESEVR